MQRVYPITEETCSALYGRPVLVYLKDGSEVTGLLSRVEKGRLILNDFSAGVSNFIFDQGKRGSGKSKGKSKKSAAKVSVQAFPAEPFPETYGEVTPFEGFGRPTTVPLGTIAVLFALGF